MAATLAIRPSEVSPSHLIGPGTFKLLSDETMSATHVDPIVKRGLFAGVETAHLCSLFDAGHNKKTYKHFKTRARYMNRLINQECVTRKAKETAKLPHPAFVVPGFLADVTPSGTAELLNQVEMETVQMEMENTLPTEPCTEPEPEPSEECQSPVAEGPLPDPVELAAKMIDLALDDPTGPSSPPTEPWEPCELVNPSSQTVPFWEFWMPDEDQPPPPLPTLDN